MLENQELEPRALALETWQMVPDEGGLCLPTAPILNPLK